MATSFGALATDFYINTKLGVKLDLPHARGVVMDFFDRVRKAHPAMSRFRKYQGELALEAPDREGASSWIALRKTSVRVGVVNPESLCEAYSLHRLALELAPFYLSVSPLDVDVMEIVFGFDLEARGNHNQLVWDAFYANSSLGALLGDDVDQMLDVQPIVGMTLADAPNTQAFFEVKTRTSTRDLRESEPADEPISVYVTLRRSGPVDDVRELPAILDNLAKKGEELIETRAVPHLVNPLRDVIASGA